MFDWLINRAKRTPYFHLDGYMRRWWLVPYGKRIPRAVTLTPEDPDPVPGSLPKDAMTSYSGAPGAWTERQVVYFDGTGPVTWRRPIAKLIQKMGLAVRVHEILRSDSGRDPHDHPFDFVTVILKGGYFEHIYDDGGVLQSTTWHGPGSILCRPAGTWHRLTLPKGETTTTLFITTQKKRVWGFNVMGTKIPHNQYQGADE